MAKRETVCFWVRDTKRARVMLRRYSDGPHACLNGPWGYHNASIAIGDHAVDVLQDAGGFGGGHDELELANGIANTADDVARDDPRWPTKCAWCSYDFTIADEWQVRWDVLYAGAPDGQEYDLMSLPHGAVWRAWWYEKWEGDGFRVGPDGMCLSVRTPAGEWCMDQKASDGGFWARTALAQDLPAGALLPQLTVTPSILQGDRYHGFLTNGKLLEC